MEKRKLRGSIEGRHSKVEVVKKDQSFLNRVDDLLQVLLWIVHIIGLRNYHPIAAATSIHSCIFLEKRQLSISLELQPLQSTALSNENP